MAIGTLQTHDSTFQLIDVSVMLMDPPLVPLPREIQSVFSSSRGTIVGRTTPSRQKPHLVRCPSCQQFSESVVSIDWLKPVARRILSSSVRLSMFDATAYRMGQCSC